MSVKAAALAAYAEVRATRIPLAVFLIVVFFAYWQLVVHHASKTLHHSDIAMRSRSPSSTSTTTTSTLTTTAPSAIITVSPASTSSLSSSATEFVQPPPAPARLESPTLGALLALFQHADPVIRFFVVAFSPMCSILNAIFSFRVTIVGARECRARVRRSRPRVCLVDQVAIVVERRRCCYRRPTVRVALIRLLLLVAF